MKPRTFEFDTTSDWLPFWVTFLATALSDVVEARFRVELVGPGGGNPMLQVEVPRASESAWQAVRDELVAGRVGWVDEEGEVHDDHL